MKKILLCLIYENLHQQIVGWAEEIAHPTWLTRVKKLI
jgi:hypothetical protein